MIDSLLFAHKFRGSVSEIKRRQSAYLDLFVGRNSLLDLGCGRGEFLELITEHGIRGTGVDDDEAMIRFCRDRGLRVVRADMFAYLRGLPDATLDSITAFQVIEHLPPAQIFELITLGAHKLRPGGMILWETQNPHCPRVLSNFYLDPTHERPVPPQMLCFLLEQSAYRVQCLRFSSPVSGADVPPVLQVTAGLPAEARLYQDYAVVAARPAAGAARSAAATER